MTLILLCWFFLWIKMKKEELVELGSANRPHGIKGGFLFHLFNPKESVLKNKDIITIFPKNSSSSIDKAGQEVQIKTIHFGNKVICYLEDIIDRNIVEQMLPFDIFYPREKFPELSSDEIYIRDLIGLKVINQSGEEVGHVTSQYDNGAQVVLKLKVGNQFMELPFVENFFPNVDLENQTITFIAPEFDE